MVLASSWTQIELLLATVIEWWLENVDFLILSFFLHLFGGIIL